MIPELEKGRKAKVSTKMTPKAPFLRAQDQSPRSEGLSKHVPHNYIRRTRKRGIQKLRGVEEYMGINRQKSGAI